MKYEQSTAANISDQEKAFRTSISNDPALSYFLETGSIRPNARFAEEKIYVDPAFLTFISPYFKEVYVDAIIGAFDTEDTSLMSDIAMNTILMDNAHRKQAFDDILAYLEQRKAELSMFQATLQMQGSINIFILAEHTSILTICNLNYLPVEFLEFRSSYAQVILKVINSLANRYLSTSMNMITDLRQLTVDTRTANDVEALYTLLNANRPTSATESGYGYSGDSNDSDSSGRNARGTLSFVVMIIITIVFTIIEMCSDGGRHHSRGSYHYHPSYRSYHRYH